MFVNKDNSEDDGNLVIVNIIKKLFIDVMRGV